MPVGSERTSPSTMRMSGSRAVEPLPFVMHGGQVGAWMR